jgi:hypothetical protein
MPFPPPPPILQFPTSTLTGPLIPPVVNLYFLLNPSLSFCGYKCFVSEFSVTPCVTSEWHRIYQTARFLRRYHQNYKILLGNYLSYIHLGSSVCRPVCHPVILSSCHNCGTLCYSFSFNNQTDSGDEMEGLEREGYGWRDRKGTDRRGRVWIDFSLFNPNQRKMYVRSAPCSCSVELYKLWFTLADFLPNWHFAGFSLSVITP